MNQGIFITATDTGVGKTMATLVLGTLLQEKGLNVGVMKPIQCAGDDAAFLRRSLKIKDSLKDINPYFAREPLSPNLAFTREKTKINIRHIVDTYEGLKERHDFVLVEGAGGLCVPIQRDYLMADLIKDLDLDVIIVSRLSLGTINHTLLTIQQAREQGLNVRGVIFNQLSPAKAGIPEKTNPAIIEQFGDVAVLGTIPYFRKISAKQILQRCKPRIKIDPIHEPVPMLRRDGSGFRPRAGKSRHNGFSPWGSIRNGFAYGYRYNGYAKLLAAWDKKYLWHPFTQMQDWLTEQPLVIDQAKGCYLQDTQGNRYLDGVSSLWVNVHGHGKKDIDRAVKDQINRLSHSTLLGLSNTPAITLAKRLVEITPKGLTKVFYSDNGSTAVEVAIKMAYQYWQNIGRKEKKDIAHLANAYHGDTLGSVSVGGIDLFHKVYRNLVFKTIAVNFPDCYRAPKGKRYPEYAFEHLEKFEALLKKRHNRIAAFVVEPLVQAAAGMIVWPQGILKRMYALCRKYEVIFIADEVATGFGRTGKMFACEHEGVSPDILCLAKGMSGGYLPLAATLTNERIYQGFLFDYKDQKTFFHGHTYTGNPLCCAAALANLEVFEKERTLEKLKPKIKFLSERLKLFYNLSHVGDVRQKGFMVGIELVRDHQTKEPYAWEERVGVRVCQQVRKKGVILRPLGNVIVLMPPLSMSIQELEKLLDVTYWAIEQVTRDG